MKVHIKRVFLFSLLIVLAGFFVIDEARAVDVRDMVFPVLGDMRWTQRKDYGTIKMYLTNPIK